METPKIDKAIREIRLQIELKKNGFNKHQSYSYFKGQDVMAVADKYLDAKDITHYIYVKNVSQLNNKTYYNYVLELIHGSELKELTYFVPEDTMQKNAVQAYGSTQTYAERYILQSLLSISDHKDDPDNQNNKIEYYDRQHIIDVFNNQGYPQEKIVQYFKMANLKSDKIVMGTLDNIVDTFLEWAKKDGANNAK